MFVTISYSCLADNDCVFSSEIVSFTSFGVSLKNSMPFVFNRCSKYFGEEFCIYYHDKEKPSLGKEVIMNDGVLYEHVFAKNGDAYYLETSYIVTER